MISYAIMLSMFDAAITLLTNRDRGVSLVANFGAGISANRPTQIPTHRSFSPISLTAKSDMQKDFEAIARIKWSRQGESTVQIIPGGKCNPQLSR